MYVRDLFKNSVPTSNTTPNPCYKYLSSNEALKISWHVFLDADVTSNVGGIPSHGTLMSDRVLQLTML